MAGATGLGLFHLRHGDMFSGTQVEDGVMAYLAVVVVFFQVKFMAEDYRISIFEIETDVFGLDGNGSCRKKQQMGHDDQRSSSQHKFTPPGAKKSF
jgi:hypothetical protein